MEERKEREFMNDGEGYVEKEDMRRRTRLDRFLTVGKPTLTSSSICLNHTFQLLLLSSCYIVSKSFLLYGL